MNTGHDRQTPPPPRVPPATETTPPEDTPNGNLDPDDQAQINNQHLEVR